MKMENHLYFGAFFSCYIVIFLPNLRPNLVIRPNVVLLGFPFVLHGGLRAQLHDLSSSTPKRALSTLQRDYHWVLFRPTLLSVRNSCVFVLHDLRKTD